MNNKVLIKLNFIELDVSYDVFIPVNELVWKVIKLLQKSIFDLNNIPINLQKEYLLVNQDSCKIYNNNEIIINTDIRNGSELIMISKD